MTFAIGAWLRRKKTMSIERGVAVVLGIAACVLLLPLIMLIGAIGTAILTFKAVIEAGNKDAD